MINDNLTLKIPPEIQTFELVDFFEINIPELSLHGRVRHAGTTGFVSKTHQKFILCHIGIRLKIFIEKMLACIMMKLRRESDNLHLSLTAPTPSYTIALIKVIIG